MNESDTRPWGKFQILASESAFQVKVITVNSGGRLSYQRHQHRSEHWFVVAGEGRVTLEGTARDVTAGSSVDVAVGMAHRIQNIGTDSLVFIEVQQGTYFGEDDIERLSDDYGRAESR